MKNQGAQIVKHYKYLAFMGLGGCQKSKNNPFLYCLCKKDILAFKPDALSLSTTQDLTCVSQNGRPGIPCTITMPQVWAWKKIE